MAAVFIESASKSITRIDAWTHSNVINKLLWNISITTVIVWIKINENCQVAEM